MSDTSSGSSEAGGHPLDDSSGSLLEELQTQAAQLQEQAAELEAFNDELSASEARLQGVIDSALDAIITTDAGSRVIDWNQHAEAMFGWSADEAVGRRITEMIIPEPDRAAHLRGVSRYLETGETRILNRRVELDAQRRDGEVFPVELAVAATRWGAEVIFTSFIRDISERRREERRRAARAEVSRVLSESVSREEAMPRILSAICGTLGWPMGVYWAVADDDSLARSAEWRDPSFGGAGTDEAAGRETIRRGEGLAGRVWADETAAHRPGDPASFAFPVRLGSRTFGVMEFLATGRMTLDEPLRATLTSVGADVGQFLSRRVAEEQLEERGAWQRFLVRVGETLAAAAPSYQETLEELVTLAVPTLSDWCSVYTIGPDGDVQRLAMRHTESEEASAAEGIAVKGDRPTRRHPVREVLRTGEPLLINETIDEVLAAIASDEEELERLKRLRITSGMIVPLTARGRVLGAILLVSLQPTRAYRQAELESATEFAARAAMFLDNARLYRDAQAANATKADFLATMSHELRTPLNAVLGYADLLLQGIPEPIDPKAETYVRRISFSAHHLLQLIEEILTYSRLEAGREKVAVAPVEMESIAEEVQAIIAPLALEKSISLKIDVGAIDRPIVTDRRKVRQILLNLMSNAVKFTEKGEVEVTGKLEGSELVLSVRDTGIGVAREHLDQIFEPFWQVEQSNTRTEHGTGLGLSVSRRFVRLLGGTITVDSEPGVGSCFEVRLPIDSSAAQMPERRTSERRAG